MPFVMVGKEAMLYYKNGKKERVKDLRAKLIELFVQRSGARGHLLTLEEAEKDRKLPGIEDYEAVFGSFENFLVDARKKWETIFRKVVLQNGKEIWTRDARKTMFEIALKRALVVGHPVGMSEAFRDRELPFPVDYIEEWGSFEAFFAELVVEWKKRYYDEEMSDVARKAKFSREQMIEKLIQIAQKAGRLPAYNDIMSDPSGPTVAMYNSQFGNLSKAYIAAGLTDAEGNKNWELINKVKTGAVEVPPEETVEAAPEVTEVVSSEVTEAKTPETDGIVPPEETEEVELPVGASEFCDAAVAPEKKSETKLVDEWSGFDGVELLIRFKDGTSAVLADPEPGVVHLVDEKVWDLAEKLGRTTDDLVVPAIKFGGMLQAKII